MPAVGTVDRGFDILVEAVCFPCNVFGMPEPDLKAILSQAGAAAFDKVKLSRGVVGKSSQVAMAAFAVLGLVAWNLREPSYLIVLACLVSILLAAYFVAVLWFANKNPGVALLEGAELIQWRQLEASAKGVVATPELTANTNPRPAITGDAGVE